MARVKIAPTVIFDIMRTLNANMTKYEQRFGPIKRIEPVQPQTPPAEGEG